MNDLDYVSYVCMYEYVMSMISYILKLHMHVNGEENVFLLIEWKKSFNLKCVIMFCLAMCYMKNDYCYYVVFHTYPIRYSPYHTFTYIVWLDSFPQVEKIVIH